MLTASNPQSLHLTVSVFNSILYSNGWCDDDGSRISERARVAGGAADALDGAGHSGSQLPQPLQVRRLPRQQPVRPHSGPLLLWGRPHVRHTHVNLQSSYTE